MDAVDFIEYDEDVVIEGSDLHQALVNAGLTDFTCTSVKRIDTQESSKLSILNHYKWFPTSLKNIMHFPWFHRASTPPVPEIKQLNIILQSELLLSDHAQEINSFHSQNVSSNDHNNGRLQWSSFLIFSSIAVTSFMMKSSRIPSLIVISGSMLVVTYYRYLQFCSTNNLKRFVSIQNDIYHLYKKILRILKNGYCIKLSSNSIQRKFSKLEVERLKYLQPICEIFIHSLEQMSSLYYQQSLYLIHLYSDLNLDHLITKLNDHRFELQGEITYDRLKEVYYMYVLVQSELMLLLATLYKHNSVNNDFFLHQQLLKIIDHLSKSLKKYYRKLHTIVENYTNNKVQRIPLQSQKKPHIKWQDFYVHSDLLARKIQSSYDNISSVIDEINNWNNSEDTDEFLNNLSEKMESIYKEIDTARNFAEFNILLINKYKKPRQLTYSELNKKSTINHSENEVPVVYDQDPFVVDEVFEEYIREEYFKPLYEDHSSESFEKMKLDTLLAKNFMSELKEVLIDKYLSMSEREAKALLRFKDKYLIGKNDDDEEPIELQKIPEPPPLPKASNTLAFYENCEPLSRSEKFKKCSDNNVMNKILKSNDIDECTLNEKFLSEHQEPEIMSIPIGINIHGIQLPKFTILEETFIGSGENSDEELE